STEWNVCLHATPRQDTHRQRRLETWSRAIVDCGARYEQCGTDFQCECAFRLLRCLHFLVVSFFGVLVLLVLLLIVLFCSFGGDENRCLVVSQVPSVWILTARTRNHLLYQRHKPRLGISEGCREITEHHVDLAVHVQDTANSIGDRRFELFASKGLGHGSSPEASCGGRLASSDSL